MKKEYTYIEELLERFFEAETSIREEKELYAFFNGGAVPEHLGKYRKMFNYFETELEGELNQAAKTGRPEPAIRRKKHWGVWTSAAAIALILLMLSPVVFKTNAFNPYEGSYIVRNGVKITDTDLIRPELEAIEREVLRQEEEEDRLLDNLAEDALMPVTAEQQVRERYEEFLDLFPDDDTRNEVIEILNNN